ncbi:hypothetical protein B0H14DRAFT_2614675 [Mycena olivaceomarginata]|nr:hypothetical protein B0H14DRAFT_2614675 [Mycena olivaceomarginata]
MATFFPRADLVSSVLKRALEFSSLLANIFTTCPSVLVQNCVFLTLFVASCKILLGNCHHQCHATARPPELSTSVQSVREGPTPRSCLEELSNEDRNVSAETALYAEDVGEDQPRYLTRNQLRMLEGKTAQKWGNPSPFQAPYHHSKAASENPSLPAPSANFLIDEDGNEIDAYGNVIGKLTQEKGL